MSTGECFFIHAQHRPPGRDALIFALGATLVLHGLFWRAMIGWKKIQKAIDYIWYCGAATAIIIGAAALAKAHEVSLFEYTLIKYRLEKDRAIPVIDNLLDYCAKEPVAYPEKRAVSGGLHVKAVKPSQFLCILAEKEKELWEKDSLITLDGKFDFRLLDPQYKYKAEQGDVDPGLNYLLAFRDYLASPWRETRGWFCDVSREEYESSGWRAEEEERRERFRKFALPSVKAPLDFGKVGNIEIVGYIDLVEPAPHHFGTEACASYEAVFNLMEEQVMRPIFAAPRWSSWLLGSWSMIIGFLIAVRLLKTTAEVRLA